MVALIRFRGSLKLRLPFEFISRKHTVTMNANFSKKNYQEWNKQINENSMNKSTRIFMILIIVADIFILKIQ